MKVWITKREAYPVYEADEKPPGWGAEAEMLPQDWIDYTLAKANYEKWQDYLERLHERHGEKDA